MRAKGRKKKKKKRNATPQGRNATQMLARRGQMQTEIAMKGGKISPNLKPAARLRTSRDHSGSS